MIIAKNLHFRQPTVHGVDYVLCRKCIIEEIDKFLYTYGPDAEFSVKDLFGHEKWNWGEEGFGIEVLYDKRIEEYTNFMNVMTEDEIQCAAYKQAAIDLGWLVKWILEYEFPHTNFVKVRYNNWCMKYRLEDELVIPKRFKLTYSKYMNTEDEEEVENDEHDELAK